MSYDVRMVNPLTGETKHLSKAHNRRGGTYALGGTTEAWLNITYNYRKFFLDTLDPEKGIRVLYGMTGREAYPILEAAVKVLGLETDADYWKATPGNAGRALDNLRIFAFLLPDSVFDGN